MAIKVFYGENRLKAQQAAQRFLGGEDYEVVEGGELKSEDLPNLFFGGSLLADSRRILVRDLLINKVVGKEITEYVGTPHKVALLETKLDKRGVVGKSLMASGVGVEEFKLAEMDPWAAFEIFRMAQKDGKQAIGMLREIQDGMEAKSFVGILAAGAFRELEVEEKRSKNERVQKVGYLGMTKGDNGEKARRILRELAKLDMDVADAQRADASLERGWVLIEGFLTRMKKI